VTFSRIENGFTIRDGSFVVFTHLQWHVPVRLAIPEVDLHADVFHLAINIVNLFSYSIINDVDFMLVNGLVWAVIATGMVLIKKPLFLTKTQP
jgi:hypothetical protein